MAHHDQLYNSPDDCTWLRETALRGYDVPVFASFTLAGHEDCPLEVRLYSTPEPSVADAPVAEYVLLTGVSDNLGYYVRKEGRPA